MIRILSRQVATTVACIATLLCATRHLEAQPAAPGRVEGTITERGRTRPIRNASVEATRLEPEPIISFTATPDDHGRFHLDSLPAGLYMIQLASATLDSLELALAPSELRVVAGRTARADFSLPLGIALRDAVCAGRSLGKGKGVVAGRAVDADTEQPISNAAVVVAWNEITVDNATLKSNSRARGAAVTTGPRGEFRLCGVPTGSWLSIQLQHGNRAGGIARVTVSDDEGAVVHNLSLSMRAAPTLATLDSVESTAQRRASDPAPDDDASTGHLTGVAAVTGTVRDPAGHPLPDVEIRVANARSVTTTDSAGKFALNGLPAGSQLLYARRLGYVVKEANVELRSDKSVTRDLQMQRIVSLDSIRIVGQRNRYPEFEYNRKNNFFGRYLTADEIARRKPTEVADLLVQLGRFTLSGQGAETKAMSDLAKRQHPACEESNVVIDGIEKAVLNFFPPSQIAAIEVYPDGTTAPSPYRSDCGVIVIWTKHYKPAPRRSN